MKFDLIIDSRSSEVVIALLRDGQLIELHKQKHDNNFSVGDIYLGKIKKVVPGLNAAFVNGGYEKDGFLHYLDLGSKVNSLKKYTEKFEVGDPKKEGEHIGPVISETQYNKILRPLAFQLGQRF